MTRYRILDELLSNRFHNYSLNDLTDEVNRRLTDMDPKSNGVVRRTIENDIRYLEYEGPFLVDIQRYSITVYSTDKKKNVTKQCLRYRNPGYSIFKKELTTDEKYLLSELLSLLGQFDGLPNLKGLEDLRIELGLKETKRKIISFSKNPLGESNLIGELFTAISQQQTIEIKYQTFYDKDNISEAVVHPYLLKEYNGRWFLFGAKNDDMSIRCYGVERIKELKTSSTYNYVPFKGDLNEYFEDIIGVTNYSDKEVEHIEFWVHPESMDYVLTKPLHESQRYYRNEAEAKFRESYPNLKGGAFFSIDCKENYELVRELMSYGNSLIVLSPDHIRKLLHKRIVDMLQSYDELESTDCK